MQSKVRDIMTPQEPFLRDCVTVHVYQRKLISLPRSENLDFYYALPN
jgi:hypothetical protein